MSKSDLQAGKGGRSYRGAEHFDCCDLRSAGAIELCRSVDHLVPPGLIEVERVVVLVSGGCLKPKRNLRLCAQRPCPYHHSQGGQSEGKADDGLHGTLLLQWENETLALLMTDRLLVISSHTRA
jgi:hypothetical protein